MNPVVLFVAAAGPRLGFGHLVRCRVLARALGVRFRLVLRGGAASRRAARQMGAELVRPGRDLFARVGPDLVVIDDPSLTHAARWVARARATGSPVASVGDLGRMCPDADLTIDASIDRSRFRPADLQGPAYAVLAPRAPGRSHCGRRRIVVALGGGGHVRQLGGRLAERLTALAPDIDVDLAPGFTDAGRLPALPRGCRWIDRSALHAALASATVAIVAGGVTLYEACAAGTPVVALAVVPAQRHAIQAFAAAGAVIDAGAGFWPHAIDRAAAAAVRLAARPDDAARLVRRGRRLVDGHGAARVAAHLRRLLVHPRRKESRRAA